MTFLSRDPEMQELLGLTSPVPAIPPASTGVLPGGAGGERALIGEPYEAASRFDREVAQWNPSRRSADGDITANKYLMDARVRDTTRNDAYGASGSEIYKDNIVGDMFLVNAKPNRLVLGLDETWESEFQEEVEAKFTLWAESPNNWVDAQRTNTLTSMVRLAIGAYAMGGEVLATAEWLKDRQRPFATAIQMIDTDRLSTPPYMRDGPGMRMGVERDSYGAPVAYHIRVTHPTDFAVGAHQWRRVPVRKPWGRQQVIHILEQKRPDQSRGTARMVAALKEARTTKKFREVVLQNAVVNATYAATIESDLPHEVIFNALGSSAGNPNAVSEAVAAYVAGYLGAVSPYTEDSSTLRLEGAVIPHLPAGSKLQMRPAAQGSVLGSDFEVSLLRYIAAALGVSYEQLSKDFSKTNYSSARASLNESAKSMRPVKRLVADRFASHVYMLWLEEAIARGEITAMPSRAPNFWDGLNREAYSACDWIGASRGQIDELKETQAAVLRLKYNLTSYEDEVSRFGKDYRKVFEQRAREEKMMESLGISIADTDDNMMNAASGDARESEARDEKDDGSEDQTDA